MKTLGEETECAATEPDAAGGEVSSAVAAQGQDAPCIDVPTVERAIKLAEWFKHEARRIYRMRVDMVSTSDRERRELLEFITRKGGKVTARQVAENFRRFNRQARNAKEELDALVVDGLGSWQKITAATGGCAADFFVLRHQQSS